MEFCIKIAKTAIWNKNYTYSKQYAERALAYASNSDLVKAYANGLLGICNIQL